MRKKSLLIPLLATFMCGSLTVGFIHHQKVNVSAIEASAAELGEYTPTQGVNDWLKDANAKNRALFNLGENVPAVGTYTQDGATVTLMRNGVTYTKTENCNLEVAGDYATYQGDVFVHLWAFGGDVGGTYAREEGDVITIEGKFSNGTDSFTVKKTTLEVGANDTLTVVGSSGSEEEISPTVIEGSYGYANSEKSGGIYFKMAENDAPYNSDWSLRYVPKTADAIKRIRNGETTDVGNTGGETLVKYAPDEYFIEAWTVGASGGYTVGDVYIINGQFVNAANNVILTIPETRIRIAEAGPVLEFLNPSYTFLNDDGNLISSTGTLAYGATTSAPLENPTKAEDDYFTYEFAGWYVGDTLWDSTVAAEGAITITAKYNAIAKNAIATSYGYTNIDMGVGFSVAKNDAPFNTDWSLRYVPVTADAIKRIRGEETVSVGNTAAETLIKYGENTYGIADWAVGAGNSGWVNGDIYVIDGYFKNEANNTIIDVAETYVQVNVTEGGSVFSVVLNPSVTFKDGDGNTLGVISYAYGARELATQPETPVKELEGYTYTFEGWYNGEVAWNFETDVVVANLVLQAKYKATANEYTATVVVDGIETPVLYNIENRGDMLAAIAAMLPQDGEGYTYAWAEVLPEVLPLENATYTVNKTAVEYTATFVADGEPVGRATYTVENESIQEPEVPAKEGYNGAWENYALEIGGVEIKAVYTAITYTITFAGVEGVAPITFTVETKDQITLPAVPELEGYTGTWDKSTDDIGLADITITAVYEEIKVPDDSSSEDGSSDDSSSDDSSSEDSSSDDVSSDDSSSDDSSSDDVSSNDSSSEDSSSGDSSSDEESSQSSGGCSGTVSGVGIGLLGVGAALLLLKKKKED